MPKPTPGQAWSRISLPISGAESEAELLSAASKIAEVFEAHLNILFAPPDPAELAPWLGEGLMGTVQMSTLESITHAAQEAQKVAEAQVAALPYKRKAFIALQSPVWQDLALETRLSDLVIFGDGSARGRGLLSEAFQQVLMEERAGVFVARSPLNITGTAVVAWDGKEPSSRAARRAVALLKKAKKVVIVGAPVGDSPARLERLADYYAIHGINAETDALPKDDIANQLVEACSRHGADYMVAGAFGRSRLHEFAFGGTTRALLQNTSLNLYMAH